MKQRNNIILTFYTLGKLALKLEHTCIHEATFHGASQFLKYSGNGRNDLKTTRRGVIKYLCPHLLHVFKHHIAVTIKRLHSP